MANSPYNIPPEMRDFAEKSVDQARKAFDGFMGAAQKAAGTMESSVAIIPGAKNISEKAMGFAQDNIHAAFDLAQKMVKAKDVSELMTLQSEYIKAQMASIQAQAKEMGSEIQKSATIKK